MCPRLQLVTETVTYNCPHRGARVLLCHTCIQDLSTAPAECHTHLSQLQAAEVAITIGIQVLKQELHQEALLGGEALPVGPLWERLSAALQRQKDVFETSIASHGAHVTWEEKTVVTSGAPWGLEGMFCPPVRSSVSVTNNRWDISSVQETVPPS